MSSRGGLAGRLVSQQLAPRLPRIAPGLASSFVREALDRAVHGAGPLPGARAAADKQRDAADGNVRRAIRAIIDTHVRYAGAQGLVTGLGGVVTAAVAIPANVTGLAVIQARMVAAIAHLRGYDLDDPRVRNAVLVCMLGEESVDRLVRERKLPAPPMALATAPVHDPELDKIISAEVASDLITRVTGRQLAVSVARRAPVVGGAVGLGADGWSTWRIGRYAAGELRPRARR
jgi:hypothetical protein